MVRGVTKRDYYEILDISRNASEQAIKHAYRKLALQYHPDRNPNDQVAEERFKEAAEAYSVLGNNDAGQRYNRFGHPNASIDDAVRQAWEAARSRETGFTNGFWEDFIVDINSRWDSGKAWRKMERNYALFVYPAIGLATVAVYLHAYYNGLDVAPFNWALPLKEIQGFEKWYQENPAGASRSSGANLVAGITFFGSLALYYATLFAKSIYIEHKSNHQATKATDMVKKTENKIIKK